MQVIVLKQPSFKNHRKTFSDALSWKLLSLWICWIFPISAAISRWFLLNFCLKKLNYQFNFALHKANISPTPTKGLNLSSLCSETIRHSLKHRSKRNSQTYRVGNDRGPSWFHLPPTFRSFSQFTFSTLNHWMGFNPLRTIHSVFGQSLDPVHKEKNISAVPFAMIFQRNS